MTDIKTFIAGEFFRRGNVIYTKDDVAYAYRIDDVKDCIRHYNNIRIAPDEHEYDCSFNEIVCPLDLPNRKYCKNYKAVD